jgi:hypothetical protein
VDIDNIPFESTLQNFKGSLSEISPASEVSDSGYEEPESLHAQGTQRSRACIDLYRAESSSAKESAPQNSLDDDASSNSKDKISAKVGKGKENLVSFISKLSDAGSGLAVSQAHNQLFKKHIVTEKNSKLPESRSLDDQDPKAESSITSMIGQGLAYVKKTMGQYVPEVASALGNACEEQKSLSLDPSIRQFEKWPTVQKRSDSGK